MTPLDPTRRGGPAVDMRSAEGKAGLTQRLAEKRADALGKTVLLPVFRPEFVADQLKEGDRG